MEFENTTIKITHVLLFIIISTLTCIYGPDFPDLGISFLIFLALRYSEPSMAAYTFLAGVLHDGFQPNKIWISPLLFPLTFLGVQVLKSNINLRFLPIRVLLSLFTTTGLMAAYTLTYVLSLEEILIKFALTVTLSILLCLFA